MFGFAAAAATARRLVSPPSFAVADVAPIPACGHLRHVDSCGACRQYRESRATPPTTSVGPGPSHDRTTRMMRRPV